MRWLHLLLPVQLILAVTALRLHKPALWILAGALIAISSLLAWVYSLRQAKLIADTPTSQIASASQGYVELKGIGSPKPEYQVVSRSGFPCIWYHCISYRRDANGNWQEIERASSDSIFEINDASGQACMVDPERAKVICTNKRTWYHDSYKHVEQQLFAGQPLYILGEFSTLSEQSAATDMRTDVSVLLAKWKQDKAGLLKRFDSNHDGQISADEWESARKMAYAQVSQQNRRLAQLPGIHMLSCPKDGRPFLISNLPEQKLLKQSTRWAWLHLLMFFASVSSLLWLVIRHGLPAGQVY